MSSERQAERSKRINELIDQLYLPESFLETGMIDPFFVLPKAQIYRGNSYVTAIQDQCIDELDLDPGTYNFRIPSSQNGVVIQVSIAKKTQAKKPEADISQSERMELVRLQVSSEFQNQRIQDLTRQLESKEKEIATLRSQLPERNMMTEVIQLIGNVRTAEATALGSAAGGEKLIDQYSKGFEAGKKSASEKIDLLESQIEQKDEKIRDLEAELEEVETELEELKLKSAGMLDGDAQVAQQVMGFLHDMKSQSPAPAPADAQALPPTTQPPKQQATSMDIQTSIRSVLIAHLSQKATREQTITALQSILNSPTARVTVRPLFQQQSTQTVVAYVKNDLKNNRVKWDESADQTVETELTFLVENLKAVLEKAA